jgi:hypothetical protein
LLFDLARCSAPGSGAGAAIISDNFEGLAFGPPLSGAFRSLLLVSDDNFSAGQTTLLAALAVDVRALAPRDWAQRRTGERDQ